MGVSLSFLNNLPSMVIEMTVNRSKRSFIALVFIMKSKW